MGYAIVWKEQIHLKLYVPSIIVRKAENRAQETLSQPGC